MAIGRIKLDLNGVASSPRAQPLHACASLTPKQIPTYLAAMFATHSFAALSCQRAKLSNRQRIPNTRATPQVFRRRNEATVASLTLPKRIPSAAMAGAAALVACALFAGNVNPLWLVLFLIAAMVATTAYLVDPGRLFSAYMAYLLIEGALKIFSNYNPVVHVGSDLLLMLLFIRLLGRRSQMMQVHPAPDFSQVRLVVPYLMLFWIWVGVQFLNPWGLGLLPSLAALKIYVMPMLVFFAVAFLLSDRELENIPFFILCLGLAEAIVATIDGALGDGYLPTLHPRYIATMSDRFVGMLYRPFGTTSLPGAPSVWMTHCLIAALLTLHGLNNNMRLSNLAKLWRKTIATLFFPFAIATLILCQGRTMLLRFGLLTALGVILSGNKKAIAALAIIGTPAVLSFPLLDGLARDGTLAPADALRVLQITSRFTSLGSGDTWTTAREGALGAMLRLSEATNLGIGLSRVGAASSLWGAKIADDPVFGDDWSFADNLYRCLFTEVGIAGLSAYLLLLVAIVVLCLRRGTFAGRLIAVNCLVFCLAGFGSEGVLYQPDAAFFWLYAAWALRLPRTGEVAS